MPIQPEQAIASEITYARRANRLTLASKEPSHIHIPRPSRVSQATSSHDDDGDAGAAELGLEEAAA